MMRALAIFAAACLPAAAVFAADSPTITSTGEAVMHTVPGTVSFTLVKLFQEADLKTATEKCGAFTAQAEQTLRAAEIPPMDVQALPPCPDDTASAPAVRGGVTAKYSMAAFISAGTGPVALGGFMDKMRALALALDASLSTPKYAAGAEDTTAASAVIQATENAYAHAETVAFALKSAIYSVQNAEIIEVKWSDRPDPEAPGPVPQISCTARVRVVYQLAPQQAPAM